jgi:serine/threonine protein kinase
MMFVVAVGQDRPGLSGGVMDPLTDQDPVQVGKFQLLGRLGAGGMGHVFLGRSQGGRPIAVKVIHREYANDPGFRTRFAREVAAAQRVSGLYTAQVIDADTDADLPWMATKFRRTGPCRPLRSSTWPPGSRRRWKRSTTPR